MTGTAGTGHHYSADQMAQMKGEEGPWQAWEVLELLEHIEDLQAEIRRHHADFEKWEEMALKGARKVEENKALRRIVKHLAHGDQLSLDDWNLLSEILRSETA